MIRKTLHSKED